MVQWGNRGTHRSTLGDFCDTPLCEQTGSIDFVCITEGYRLMEWFLLFYRALVEEYFDPACEAGSIMLMNFNLYSSYQSDTYQVTPRRYFDSKVTKIYQSDS